MRLFSGVWRRERAGSCELTTEPQSRRREAFRAALPGRGSRVQAGNWPSVALSGHLRVAAGSAPLHCCSQTFRKLCLVFTRSQLDSLLE